jgi:hypothetical protein
MRFAVVQSEQRVFLKAYRYAQRGGWLAQSFISGTVCSLFERCSKWSRACGRRMPQAFGRREKMQALEL